MNVQFHKWGLISILLLFGSQNFFDLNLISNALELGMGVGDREENTGFTLGTGPAVHGNNSLKSNCQKGGKAKEHL